MRIQFVEEICVTVLVIKIILKFNTMLIRKKNKNLTQSVVWFEKISIFEKIKHILVKIGYNLLFNI